MEKKVIQKFQLSFLTQFSVISKIVRDEEQNIDNGKGKVHHKTDCKTKLS